MIKIDGSVGEGGGQILRTSLALSMCTGKPFQMTDIRAKRKKPGLLRQHLTAVNAAKTVCGAEVTGAGISSQTLTFIPGEINPGKYHFSVGTAGSATLVLQTILPALLCAKAESMVHLEGGTHNPWAPPFHFLKEAFLPILDLMGASCKAELTQWGFYPAGGGKFSVDIAPPTGKLRILELSDRGRLLRSEILAGVSKVPWEVANDECKLITQSAAFPITQTRAENVPSPGPGNVAMLGMKFEKSFAWFTGFGEIGVSRKKVAHLVSGAANRFFKSGAAVEDHLADQLLIPMALAGGGSFTTVKPTSHTTTNIEIVKKFLDVRINLCQESSQRDPPRQQISGDLECALETDQVSQGCDREGGDFFSQKSGGVWKLEITGEG